MGAGALGREGGGGGGVEETTSKSVSFVYFFLFFFFFLLLLGCLGGAFPRYLGTVVNPVRRRPIVGHSLRLGMQCSLLLGLGGDALF